MLWSMSGAAGVQILGLIFSLWLANLIDPIVFGIFAIPSIVARFSKEAIDVGLGAAIVQSDEINDGLLSTIFWLNLMLSIVLALIVFFGAPYFALYTGEDTQIVYRLLAPVFIITGITLTQRAILLKALNFKRIAIADFSSTAIGGLLAIYLAYQSPDVFALIARFAAIAIVTSLIFWISTSWRPRLAWENEGLRNVLSFSLPVFATKSIKFLANYFDELMFPKFVNQELLGSYNRSRVFVSIPSRVIRDQIASVLFPAFSTIKSDVNRMSDIYGKAISAVAVFGLVPLSLIILLAPEAIPVFLNEKWLSMIPIAQAMALMMAPNFLSFFSPVLLSRGKSRLDFKVRMVVLLIRVISILLGLYFGGLPGLLLSLIIFGWIAHLIYLYVIGLELEKGVWWQLRLELPGWIIQALSLCTAWVIAVYIFEGLPMFWVMLIKLALFISVFIAMLLIFKPRGFMIGRRLAKEYHYKFGPLGRFLKKL